MRNKCRKPTTRKGITYYPCYMCARRVAEGLGLTSIRLVSYTRGWAVQREVSGPYYSEKAGAFA